MFLVTYIVIFVRSLCADFNPTLLQRVSPETFFVRICDSIKKIPDIETPKLLFIFKISLWTFFFSL